MRLVAKWGEEDRARGRGGGGGKEGKNAGGRKGRRKGGREEGSGYFWLMLQMRNSSPTELQHHCLSNSSRILQRRCRFRRSGLNTLSNSQASNSWVPGYCLVSLHFRCQILWSHPVQTMKISSHPPFVLNFLFKSFIYVFHLGSLESPWIKPAWSQGVSESKF